MNNIKQEEVSDYYRLEEYIDLPAVIGRIKGYSKIFLPMAEWKVFATFTFDYDSATKKSARMAFDNFIKQMNIDNLNMGNLIDNGSSFLSFIMCIAIQEDGSILINSAFAGNVDTFRMKKFWNDQYGSIDFLSNMDQENFIRCICKNISIHDIPDAGFQICIN